MRAEIVDLRGSIMRGWMNDERVMITCCSDGTRPVIFKIERLDYKVLYIEGAECEKCEEKISAALKTIQAVELGAWSNISSGDYTPAAN